MMLSEKEYTDILTTSTKSRPNMNTNEGSQEGDRVESMNDPAEGIDAQVSISQSENDEVIMSGTGLQTTQESCKQRLMTDLLKAETPRTKLKRNDGDSHSQAKKNKFSECENIDKPTCQQNHQDGTNQDTRPNSASGSSPMKDIQEMSEREKLDCLLIMVMEIKDKQSMSEHVVNKAVDEKLQAVKKEVNNKLDSFKKDVLKVINTDNKEKNFVIRNLPEGDKENIMNKVHAVLRDGMKLKIEVDQAERKKSYREGQSGLVIVTCKSVKDKQLVMESKRKLGDSRVYRNVGIDHDKSKLERDYSTSIQAIARAVGNDRLKVKGNCVVYQDRYSQQSGRRDSHRSRHAYDRRQQQTGGDYSQKQQYNRGRREGHRQAEYTDDHFSREDQHSRGRREGNRQAEYAGEHTSPVWIRNNQSSGSQEGPTRQRYNSRSRDSRLNSKGSCHNRHEQSHRDSRGQNDRRSLSNTRDSKEPSSSGCTLRKSARNRSPYNDTDSLTPSPPPRFPSPENRPYQGKGKNSSQRNQQVKGQRRG
jgi:hypothetical protein